MPRFLHYVLIILAAAVVTLAVNEIEVRRHPAPAPVIVEKTEQLPAPEPQQVEERSDQPAFDRVMKSNTLRCGYIVQPPEFTKDGGGKFSGAAFDAAETMARSLNLRLEWAEEVTLATMADSLKSGRIDAVCFPLYLNHIAEARVIDLTAPLYFTGSGIYVRASDDRFNNDISLINAQEMTVATLEGQMSQTIRATDFPLSKNLSLSEGSAASLLQAVESGKADATFVDQLTATPYLMADAGKLRDLMLGNPLALHGHAFAVSKGETRLAQTLGMALREMQYSGQMDRILQKDGLNLPSVLRPAKPYATLK